ncbi:MAG: hypothetical protein ACRBCT_04970 [Alphaproteobacteria bacterium]
MKLFKSKQTPSAKVIDGKLIMTFPNATTPVVWQMDLGSVKTATLEVLERKEGFALSLKTAEGEKQDIAKFTSRDESITALMTASKALETAQGHITTNNNTAPQKSGTWKKVLTSIAALIILFFVFIMWNANRHYAQIHHEQTAASTTTGQNPAQTSAGVPVSADDFLSGM